MKQADENNEIKKIKEKNYKDYIDLEKKELFKRLEKHYQSQLPKGF